MTDELTPEERDALRNLPRERMPSAALEERVVGAMRARGVLAAKQRGKVVRLTTGRVAGLLAASVVLVAGAYYIGQRGVGEEVVRDLQEPASEFSQMGELDRKTSTRQFEPGTLQKQEAPATLSAPAESREATPQEEGASGKEAAPPLEWKLKDTDAAREREPATADDAVAESAEQLSVRGGRADESSESADDASKRDQAASAAPAPSSEPLKREPTAPTVPAPSSLRANKSVMQFSAPTKRERSFALDGSTLIIDAPDRVRVAEAPEEHAVRITASDGVIRIRPADAGTDRIAPMGSSVRSFQIGGSRFVLDAPDSVRVEEDRVARTLLIHTSDGIVRIRLDD